MGKDTFQERHCGSKEKYHNWVQATKAAYALEVFRPGKVVDVYRCQLCRCIHIGNAKTIRYEVHY